jgi:hypothetical protein
VGESKKARSNDDAIGTCSELGGYGIGLHDHPGDAPETGAIVALTAAVPFRLVFNA